MDKQSQEAWRIHKPTVTQSPTIYDMLKARLGREPTNAEITARCKQIISEGNALAREDKANV